MEVITDFAIASTPKGEIAQRLAAEALEQIAKSEAKSGGKEGVLRRLSVTRGDEFSINPYLIETRKDWNIRDLTGREASEKLDILARSIAKNGVLEALSVVVKGDKFYVSNGHRRLLATFRAIEVYGAEIKAIPVRQESKALTEVELLDRQFIRNSGEPLSPIDRGTGILRYIAWNFTHEQIAERLGFDGPARVVQILRFMEDANDGIKEMVANGEVSQTLAADVLRDSKQDADKAEEILSQAVDNAKAEGKTKATRKHITDNITPKMAMKTILESAKTIIETGDKTVTITMPTEFWEQISKLYKIV